MCKPLFEYTLMLYVKIYYKFSTHYIFGYTRLEERKDFFFVIETSSFKWNWFMTFNAA